MIKNIRGHIFSTVIFSPGPATSRSGTVIGNSVCVLAFLFVCMLMALAQLTDKMDPMYIIPKDRPEPHDDAHVIFFSSVLPIY